MNDRVIAIDGPAGSGKSTVARRVADALGWSYLDTGAMYRAVTVRVLALGLAPDDLESVARVAASCVLDVDDRVIIDGRDVSERLRDDDVNLAVSAVAANPGVRTAMVERQRAFARHQTRGTVVEGRDITTVVFPRAGLKVYLTASDEERARRRGDEDPTSVARRDAADRSRAASPLRQDVDARVVDTTDRTVEDVVEEIVTWAKTLS